MTDDAFKQQFKELLEFQSANFEFFDHEIEQRDNNRTKENDDVNLKKKTEKMRTRFFAFP